MSKENEASNKKVNPLVRLAPGRKSDLKVVKEPTHIVKWYETEMSIEDKARFNLLTYPEYVQWVNEQLEKQRAEMGAEGACGATGSADGRSTFWENDTEERTNVDSSEYEAFLDKNNIDVSNRTAVDFDALYAEVNKDTPAEAAPAANEQSEEELLASVLSNVDKDIHGDTILTEEEIAALFAAANGN